ncbi:hypothetical protein AB0B78_06225 [Streptomyces sp. NPDC040724]|uniref:hypothetical protein n=1 Tax=Streptomyces sp. NPDC040724 TaxID=3155612 RepID=UPI0033C88107
MNRRTLPVAVVATATAALLLSACGGGGGKTDDKITGSEQSATPSASASASASPSDTAGRPKVTLPADFKNEFEGWTTGDPVKDAVLADISNAITSVDAAIASDEAESSAVAFYHKGDALVGASTWIAKLKNDGLTPTGVTRYHTPNIAMSDQTSAGVVYCADESKGFAKERKTGKVLTTPVDDKSYVMYNARVEKNQQGVWQTTQLTSKRGDKTCTP